MHLESSPHTTHANEFERPMIDDWIDVCSLDDLLPGVGAAVLVADQQIALFRDGSTERVFAISNFDPFSEAFVLSRGIVGDRGGVPKVASPMYKQNFDLKTGRCLDDDTVRVPVYETRVSHGRVLVRAGAPS